VPFGRLIIKVVTLLELIKKKTSPVKQKEICTYLKIKRNRTEIIK
jgi:hypothetical protein